MSQVSFPFKYVLHFWSHFHQFFDPIHHPSNPPPSTLPRPFVSSFLTLPTRCPLLKGKHQMRSMLPIYSWLCRAWPTCQRAQPQWRWTFPLRHYQVPAYCSLSRGGAYWSLGAGVSIGCLGSHRSCACCLAYCELTCAVPLPSPALTVFSPRCSAVISEPCGGEAMIYMSHLGLSIPHSPCSPHLDPLWLSVLTSSLYKDVSRTGIGLIRCTNLQFQ